MLQLTLGTEHTLVSGTFLIDQDFDPYAQYYIHSPRNNTLEVEIVFDQRALGLNTDLFSITNEKLSDFLIKTSCAFMQRRVEPFRSDFVCRATYSLRISDYEQFVSNLEKYSRQISDIEFTKALEVKLSDS